jgi:hypothetical protein
MLTSKERAFEEHARLREIRAELADLQDQAMELCEEAERLIERHELEMRQGFPRPRKRARGCLRAAG